MTHMNRMPPTVLLLRTEGPSYLSSSNCQADLGECRAHGVFQSIPWRMVVVTALAAMVGCVASSCGTELLRAGWLTPALRAPSSPAVTLPRITPSRMRVLAKEQVRRRLWPLPAANDEGMLNTSPTTFKALGVSKELVDGLTSIHILTPSPIQRSVIPELLSGANVAFAATTGSGKTLAYMLPLIQALKDQEVAGLVRKEKRPRALVFVPTRELASQVLGVAKALGHHAKIASCMIVGGELWAKQRLALANQMDIVVATPGRLLEHWKKGHFFLSEVNKVVIDEVDTMLTQGFTSEVMSLLTHVLTPNRPVQVMMATATMTRQVKTWLGTSQFKDLQILEAPDVHCVVSSLRHMLVQTKGRDKLQVLQEVIRSHSRTPRTMIFCNTVDAVRAVTLSMNEVGIESLPYHKELPLGERSANMERFRTGESGFLVCTDIGQRGLDIDIEHVILFDFPLNPIDFLHRAGRTARMGKPGTVTSIVSKREYTLAHAIDTAIAKGEPLERLTSNPNDYKDGGRLAALVGHRPKSANPRQEKRAKAAAATSEASTSRLGQWAKKAVPERRRSVMQKAVGRKAIAKRMAKGTAKAAAHRNVKGATSTGSRGKGSRGQTSAQGWRGVGTRR